MNGTSINSTDVTVVNAAKTETIDKGATGISYEMALVQYTRFIAESNIDRFVSSEDNEEELSTMSEYLINTDFEEVWKPKVGQHGIITNEGLGPGENDLMYKWGWRYMNDFLSVLVTIGTGGINLLAGWGFNSGDGIGGQSSGGVQDGSYAAFKGAWPEIADVKKEDNEQFNGGWGMKYDGFERKYLGPHFTNKSAENTSNYCDVSGRAAACFKTSYSFNPGTLKYITGLPEVGHYIIDPKRPPFVENTAITINKMPGLNTTWVYLINTAVNEGKNYIKGYTHPDAVSEKRVKGKNGYRVTREKSDYKNKDYMQKALSKGYFLPQRGEFVPKPFTEQMKDKIVNGATKYAMCKDLKPSETTDEQVALERFTKVMQTINSNWTVPGDYKTNSLYNLFLVLVQNEKGAPVVGCNGAYGVEDGDIGYGYLFESEDEAREWAEYTYEMHYVYSSITKNEYMGYPLMGQNVYFEAVFSKIKLLRGLYAQRGINTNEVMSLYAADLDKRIGDYASLGEIFNGSKSKNIKYSQGFYEAFAMLNFSGNTNLEAFNQTVANGTSSGSFNTAELAALNAGRSSAVRTNEALKKVSQYAKDTANLTNDKALFAPNSLRDKLVNPIGAIQSANPGGSFSRGSLGMKLDAINNKLANISKAQKKKYKGSGSSAYKNNFSIPSYQPARSSYGSSDSATETSTSGVNSGMSTADANALINQLKKNKDLTQPLDSDTLFTRVSKAYKRSYSRVLHRTSKVSRPVKKKAGVTSKEKEQLKLMLEK